MQQYDTKNGDTSQPWGRSDSPPPFNTNNNKATVNIPTVKIPTVNTPTVNIPIVKTLKNYMWEAQRTNNTSQDVWPSTI